MKKSLFLPVFAVLGGIAAFILRLLQNQNGFDSITGLPVRGTPFNFLLPLFLLLFAVCLLLTARKQPQSKVLFPRDFLTGNLMLLTVAVCGIFLMGVSGALELISSVTGTNLLPGPDGLVCVVSARTMQAQRIGGILSILSAASLFPAIVTCRKREDGAAQSFTGAILLIPIVCLVVRLVLCYRDHSINPVLAAYYPELLALVFLALGFYRLSSFAFGQGRPRLYAVYTGMSVVLALVQFADGITPAPLFYLGAALALTAFYLFFQDSSADAPTVN